MTGPRGAGRRLALALLVALALLPALPQLEGVLPGLAPLARGFELWFDLHCHRDPARSLLLAGTPLAVCARCSGIYWGLGLGGLLRRPRLPPGRLQVWLALAAGIMLLDVALEALRAHASWPALRLGTGMLLAYPVGAALGQALEPRALQSP